MPTRLAPNRTEKEPAITDAADLIPNATSPAFEAASLARALAVVGRLVGLSFASDDLATLAAADEPRGVFAAAERLNLRCRPRRLSWNGLRKRRGSLPAIVRLADGTSLVLIRFEWVDNAPYVLLEDPGANRDSLLVLDRARFEAAWSGDVVFVRRHYDIIDETVPFGLELISKLFFRQRRLVLETAICTVALSVLALTPMLFMRLVMGRVMQYRAVDTLIVICVITAVVFAIETGLGAAKRYVSDRLSTKVDVRLSMLVFNKMLRLPMDYFETVPAGLTLSRISQLRKLRESLLTTAFGSVLDVGVLIVFVPVMMLLSVPLTLVILTVFAITVAWILLTLPAFRRATGLAEKAEVARGTFLFQNLSGMRTVKSLALDARQRHQWDVLVADSHAARLNEGRVTTLIDSVVTMLQRLLICVTMLAGAYLALRSGDSVAVGTLFTYVLLSQRVAAPLNQAAELVQAYDDSRRSIAYIAAMTNQPEEEGRSGHGIRKPLRGHVEFVNLNFKYRGSVGYALRTVNFEVPAGMTLGVMGRSGSGKTTITRLLQRLHSDYQGVIRIDGVDVREYDVDHLRSSLGVVLQDNFLFSGTIRENITAAKSDASLDDVVRVARLAGAEEFIDKLPRGYDTYIYEGSPNLSGGQRQRLAIARALITDPKLLILDEATSALDAESEAIVNANLRRIAQGRTMIVISHRLSSLVNADAIMVLDRGEVQDIGKHQELLERNDIYSGLWYHQNPSTEDNMAA